MRLSARLPLLVVCWLAAEFIAFGLIARAVGFSGALVLCFLTSLVGFAMLRRLGLASAWRLRRAMASRSHAEAGLTRAALVDGGLAALGSILLILPGFASDLIGLALAAPSIRARLAERLQAGGAGGRAERQKAAPGVIDLDPQEWSRGGDPDRRRPPPRLGARKQTS